MLAVSDAVAGARQRVDHAVRIHELHVIRLRSLDKRVPLHSVQTKIAHTVFRIVRIPALRDRHIDAHPVQLPQREGAVVRAAGILRVRLRRRFIPAHHLPARKRRAVERQNVRPGKGKPTGHVGIRHADHALVVRQIDAEVVVDIHDAPALSLELAVYVHQIAAVQVEPVVIVVKRHIPLRELHAHHRPPRLTLFRNVRRHRSGHLFLFLRYRKPDLERHIALPFQFFISLMVVYYCIECPIIRTSVKI